MSFRINEFLEDGRNWRIEKIRVDQYGTATHDEFRQSSHVIGPAPGKLNAGNDAFFGGRTQAFPIFVLAGVAQ